MSAEPEAHCGSATKAGRKRHHSSDADSIDTSIIAWNDGMTPPHDMAPPPRHDDVVPHSDGAVTNQTKAALVKKLRDSTKQQHLEQAMLPEVTSPGSGKSKVARQEPVMSPLVARWHHKPGIQPTQSSLLEDVLNEKKLELLQSPEVRVFLEQAQRSIAEDKRHNKTPEGATLDESVTASPSADDGSTCQAGYPLNTDVREMWTNARTTNVAGADIWSKEASAFTSVVRPTQQ